MKRRTVLPLVCCLISFALGALTLGWRNVWGDEAFAVWASKQPVLALLRSLDNSPPGYYLSLKLGRAIWGETVFAVRFASVCFGVAFVALAARLGQLMGGARGAIACAAVVGLAPMTSYFAQEARMYTQALALCAATMALTLRVLQRGWRTHNLFALSVFSVLALFTHLYSVAVLAVNALALLIAAWRQPQRAANLRRWALSHGTIVGIYGAWFFGFQLAVLRTEAGTRTTPLLPPLSDWPGYAARGITGLLLGVRAEAWLAPVAVAALIFLLAGLAFLRRHRGLVMGWVGLPIVLALATATLVPEFSPRYFLFALLPLALAAVGWVQVGRDGARGAPGLARVALAAVVFGASVYGNAVLFDVRWDKSRYRQALQMVQAQSRPTDGLVLVNSDQFPMYDFYGPVTIQTVLISNDTRQAAQNEANVEALLQIKRRIWLLNYGAAIAWNTPLEQQLKATALRVYADGFGDASLALYDLSGGSSGEIQPRAVPFGEAIRLTGSRIRTSRLAPGDTLALDLFWQASQSMPTDYTVFVHVRRADDGAQIAANDSPPVNGAAPTSSWGMGQVITDVRGVSIPVGAVPGIYSVYIGLYQYPSFERLKILGTDQNEFVVGQVVVE